LNARTTNIDTETTAMSDSTKLNQDAKIAVIGAGIMGIGIAQVAAGAGHPVKLYDQSQSILEQSLAGLSASLQKRVEKGKMSVQDQQTLLSNIQLVSDINDLADCELAIEVIIENIDIKQSVFKELESILSNKAIIATNTSSFSISALAKQLEHPGRFVGMHFFNPAPVLKLVEVVAGLKTEADVVDKIYELALSWGKKPVKVTSSPGFIVNRVARPYYAEALKSLQEQASDVATIDTLMRETMGFKLGPFQLIDLVGIDINQAATQSIYDAYFQDPRFRPSVLLKEMLDAGLLGRKSNRGFYDYSDSRANNQAAYLPTSTLGPVTEITVYGELGIAEALIKLAQEHQITVTRHPHESGFIEIGHTRLQMSTGRTASDVAAESQHHNTVVFDLARDYHTSAVIGIATAVQADQNSAILAAAFLQQLGKEVVKLKDVPGLLVLRTMCMLANEAADTANQGVASPEAIDMAMQLGVAYPVGPLDWAQSFGLDKTVAVLQNLHESYREERYRCSPWLKTQSLMM